MTDDLVKLCAWLRGQFEKSRDQTGDLMYLGPGEPRFIEAASALESLTAENAALEAERDWLVSAGKKQGAQIADSVSVELAEARNEAFERAAGAARQVAINAERRAADHIPQSAAANAALDKSEGAYAAEAAIRNLSKES